MIEKNSKIIIRFKTDSKLEPALGCILLEDTIAFLRVLNVNVELLIPWNSIDFIEEDKRDII